jgi:prepilin-type N-terminal cleavage/methylation domain-containing protein
MKRRTVVKKIKGFTFMELLIVLAIISLLAMVAIPIFDSFSDRSKVDELKSVLLVAAVAQEKYFTATGTYAALPDNLSKYGFPAPSNERMTLDTGAIIRPGLGMTYWVGGKYEIGSGTECWVYLGSIAGSGSSDNFVKMEESMTGCTFCPDYNDICN